LRFFHNSIFPADVIKWKVKIARDFDRIKQEPVLLPENITSASLASQLRFRPLNLFLKE